MDDRILQFRVGVVVVAAAIITVSLIMLFGEGRALVRGYYAVHVRFPEAPGVTVGTPVRKSGILIGRVSDVRLLDEGGVVLSMRVEDRYNLRRNEVPRIGTGSLVTGDAVLEFVPSPEEETSEELIRDGEYIANGFVVRDPLQALAGIAEHVPTAIRSVELAGGEVALLARNINVTLGDNQEQFQRILQKSEIALDRMHVTMMTLQEMFQDPELRDALKESLAALPRILDEAQLTLADARKTLATFERMGHRAEQNLAHLEDFTRPLGERGERLAENLDRSVQNLDEMLAQLVQFSQALGDRSGTVGQLVYDREIYERLHRAAGNIEDATRRIQPILNDVRVFSDKIARDPRQLGVKGAIDRRPTGLKTGVQ